MIWSTCHSSNRRQPGHVFANNIAGAELNKNSSHVFRYFAYALKQWQIQSSRKRGLIVISRAIVRPAYTGKYFVTILLWLKLQNSFSANQRWKWGDHDYPFARAESATAIYWHCQCHISVVILKLGVECFSIQCIRIFIALAQIQVVGYVRFKMCIICTMFNFNLAYYS